MSWDKFLMKKLLKSEVCGTREQSLLKSQNMWLRKKKKKKRKETQTWIRKRKSKRILSYYPLSIVTKKKKKGDIIGKVGYCVYKYMFFFYLIF